MYKFGVLCLFLVACARYADAFKDLKTIIQTQLVTSGIKCLREYPLSLSDISSLKDKIMPNNRDAKCFTACLFKEVGIMDDMGNVSPSTARESAKEVFRNSEDNIKKAGQIVSFCSKVNERTTSDGNKGCERAKLAFNCLTKNAARYGFDVDFS